MKNKISKKWESAQNLEKSSFLDTEMDTAYYLTFWKSFLRRSPANLLVKKMTDSMNLLDIGSGPVSILHSLPGNYREMIAIDSLNDAYSKKFEGSPKINYISAPFENFAIKREHFDVIFCINALDHMISWKSALRKIVYNLKPNGYLLLCYENTTPIVKLFEKYGYKKHLADYHLHDLQFRYVHKYLTNNKISCRARVFKSDLNWNKIVYGFKQFTGFSKRSLSKYDKKVSIFSQSKNSVVVHACVSLLEYMIYSVSLLSSRFCNRVESLYQKVEE